MTGEQFLDRLRHHIAPASIAKLTAPGGSLLIVLSDGREVKPRRGRVRDCADDAALDAYVAELLA